MQSFGIATPGRVLFGRGQAAQAAGLIARFGPRGVVVHGADAARAAITVEFAGAVPARDTARVVRCTTSRDPRPTVAIVPAFGATVAPDVQRALADVGIDVEDSGEALRLAFPGVPEP